MKKKSKFAQFQNKIISKYVRIFEWTRSLMIVINVGQAYFENKILIIILLIRFGHFLWDMTKMKTTFFF
jgi:hypothetical protein